MRQYPRIKFILCIFINKTKNICIEFRTKLLFMLVKRLLVPYISYISEFRKQLKTETKTS